MNLLYKHLIKQVGRNKVFVVLLFILTCLASLSYFFVKFSVDGNLAMLDSQALLSENQKKYRDALLSNTNLAYIFLFAMTILTAFVFIMFFYRFSAQPKTDGLSEGVGVYRQCFAYFLSSLLHVYRL